jgi:hypothetical protein
MTRVNDPIPMLVFVPVEGGRHIVYAGLQADIERLGAEAVYATTLCGLPCGLDPVQRRREAKGLPTCAPCVAEDLRRYPDGASRRLLRQV